MGNDTQVLTYEKVLALYPPNMFKQAIKTGTLRIRPFTEEDERTFPPTRDLEGRLIKAKVGRCLCVGVEGEWFDCSLWPPFRSLLGRFAVFGRSSLSGEGRAECSDAPISARQPVW